MITKHLKNRLFKTQTFSFTELSMPIVDLRKFIQKSQGWENECKLTAECLNETGILVIRDPVSRLLFNIIRESMNSIIINS
jgi:hypothetical protein